MTGPATFRPEDIFCNCFLPYLIGLHLPLARMIVLICKTTL